MDFIVLSSSRGTTFQAVIDAMANGELEARCLGLISNSEKNGCVDKANTAGIPVTIVKKETGESREEYDQRLHEAICKLIPDVRSPKSEVLIAALGWMFIFSESFIAKWKNRIINVHPALLPKYGGKGMYGMRVHEAVLAAGESESGISIHIMDEGVDTGLILEQKICSVYPDDTPETLKMRVQELEKEWYPKVLERIHTGQLELPAS